MGEPTLKEKAWEEGGLVGGLIAGGLVSAFSSRNPEEEHRPSKLVFEPTIALADHLQDKIAEAPDIPSCKEYFTFPKKEISKIRFDLLSNLMVNTQYLDLQVSSPGQETRVSAFLKVKGYPFEG